MLSREEAVFFIDKTLGISCPLQKISKDPLQFLNELLPAFQAKIPFQSLSLIATEPGQRRRPTFNEIKDDVMSARGGLCYTLNLFMKHLLEALGYHAHLASASIGGIPHNHPVVVVKNVKNAGDRYFVDMGTGFPFLRPVALDFEDETPEFSFSFVQYKYQFKDGKLVQYIKKNTKFSKLEEEKSWRQFVVSDLKPVELSHMYELVDRGFSDINSKVTPFHNSVRIAGAVGPERRMVAFRDACLLVENESKCLEETFLTTDEDYLESVARYFPNLKQLAELVLKSGRVNLKTVHQLFYVKNKA